MPDSLSDIIKGQQLIADMNAKSKEILAVLIPAQTGVASEDVPEILNEMFEDKMFAAGVEAGRLGAVAVLNDRYGPFEDKS